MSEKQDTRIRLTELISKYTGGSIVRAILEPIPNNPDEAGNKTASDYKLYADSWLGIVERAISFIAGLSGFYMLVVAWMAFKVASKWENWSNIVKFEKDIVKEYEKRRAYGGNIYTRFLIGSGLNIFIGFTTGIIISALFTE